MHLLRFENNSISIIFGKRTKPKRPATYDLPANDNVAGRYRVSLHRNTMPKILYYFRFLDKNVTQLFPRLTWENILSSFSSAYISSNCRLYCEAWFIIRVLSTMFTIEEAYLLIQETKTSSNKRHQALSDIATCLIKWIPKLSLFPLNKANIVVSRIGVTNIVGLI